jgi:hypothetical protein
MPEFIPGLQLSERFYREAVRPIIVTEFPGLKHSAALIGSGSEVLGFDTEMSTDHDWGPRVLLFFGEEHALHGHAIREALSRRLPRRFLGYRTDFEEPEDAAADRGHPVQHRVETQTLRGFFQSYVGFDLNRELEVADWLTLPEQKLRAITAGAVYHDDLGLEAVRERFAYYPRDVWLYLLAAGWKRIGQEEHLMGRAGLVGDEIGSAIIGARLVRDLMRLCFLMERQYAPYPKWFGTAFARLACGPELAPILRRAQLAAIWPEREKHLCAAYEYVAAMQNALGITERLPATVAGFHNRPFRVIHHDEGFAQAIQRQIRDPEVGRIASRRLIGSIDQWSDSTDILTDAGWRPALRRLYEADDG